MLQIPKVLINEVKNCLPNKKIKKKSRFKFFLLFSSLFLTIQFTLKAQNPRITGITGNRCNGTNFTLHFSYDTTNTPTTPITAQLSDVNGLFSTPYTLGSTSTLSNGTGSINCIFTSQAAATSYKIRILRAIGLIATDTSNTFTISIPSTSFTFTPNNVCSGTPISFTNSSASIAGIASYEWAFGATLGAPANNSNANPTVTFNPGVGNGISNYSASLSVSDNNGCIATSMQTNAVQVKRLPDASLMNLTSSPFVSCNDSLRVQFTIDNASSTFATNTNYQIIYGNSITRNYDSTFLGDTITYQGFGFFQLRNIVTNNLGCTKDTIVKIFNGRLPAGVLDNPGLPVSSCIPFSFFINYSSLVYQNPPGTTYLVSFTNGRPDTILNHPPDSFIHTISNNSCGSIGSNGSTIFPNSFQVNLVATNPCGSNGSVIVPIRTRSKTEAEIIGDTVSCINGLKQYRDNSINGIYPSGNPIGSLCDSQTYRRWFITPSTYTIISGSLGANYTPILQGSQSINIRYDTIGVYTIKLVKNSLSSCGNDTSIKTICVQPIPTPNFTLNINPSNRCLPVTVNTTNTSNTLSSCGTTTYTWNAMPNTGVNFTGGTNANSQNAQLVFNNSGTFTLRLTITNQCTTVVKDTIIIIKGPPNVILQSNQTYCGQQSILFNNSIGPNRVHFDSAFSTTNTYNWSVQPSGASFINGTNNTTKFPTILFPQLTSPTTYKIIAQITNECGTNNDTQEITILPKPGLPLGIRDTSRCGPGPFLIGGNIGTFGTNIRWFAQNGSLLDSGLTFSRNITNSTNYFAKSIIGSTGCISDSVPFKITINPIPAAALNAVNTSRCGPGIISLSATSGSNGNTLRWYTLATGGSLIDSGNTINRNVTATTTFYVSTYNSFTGCESSAPKLAVTATVNQIPVVSAGQKNQSYCNQNSLVTLSTFSPSLTGPNGTGTWSSIPAGKVNANGTFNPSNSGVGAYQFIYTFTSTNGCSNSDTINVSIINPAIAVASNDTVICKLNKTFQLIGLPIGGFWNGIKVNSSGIFNSDSAGVFKLYYNYGSGTCLTKDSTLITVIAAPTPSFTIIDSLCKYDSYTLNASANTTFGSNNFNWIIGNNGGLSNSILSNSSISNPIVVYPENKTSNNVVYSFKLFVTNGLGCIDSLSKTAILLRRPNAKFTIPTPFCGPTTFNTNNTSLGNPNRFNWTINPSISVSIATPTTFNTLITLPKNISTFATNYQIRLITGIQQNNKVCYDTISNQTTVNQSPLINFTPLDSIGCQPLNISFINISDPRNGSGTNLMNFEWLVNNVPVSNNLNYSRIFTNLGTTDSIYQIKLRGINNLGCIDSVAKNIIVHPNPKALFAATIHSACPPFIIGSTNIGLNQFPIANGQYIWQFLNPNKTVRKQVLGLIPPTDTIINGLDSIYLRLIAISPNGCRSDTFEMVFRTIANPVAGFTMSDSLGCHPLSVQLTNTSSTGVSLNWRLGNGNSSTLANPLVTYTNFSNTVDSVYRVKLVVTAGGTGCRDSFERVLRVYPKPLARFSLVNNVCANNSILPNNTSLFKASATINTYRWVKFNNSVSLSDSSIAAPIIAFAQNQTSTDSLFNIRLRITSVDGCTHDTTRPITQVAVPVSQFSLSNKGCGPINLQALNLTSNVPTNSVWSVEPTSGVNIVTNTSVSPNITFPINLGNDSIIYKVRLVSTRSTILDCRDTSYRNITIYPKPTIDFNISDTALCSPALFIFSNQSNPKNGELIGSMLFNWNFGNGILSGARDSLMRYTNSSTIDNLYTVKLRGTTQHGCSDSATKIVRIWPDAKAVFTATNTTSCAPFVIDNTVISTQTFPQANSSYRWFVNNLLLGTGAAFPGYTLSNPLDSVVIKLVTTSLNACKDDSIQMVFRTIANPVAGFTMSDSLGCHPLSVQLTNTSSSGVSLNWRLGNGNSSTLANPLPTYPNFSQTVDSVYRVKLVVTAGGTGCRDSFERLLRVYPKPLARFSLVNNICANNSILPSNTSLFKGSATINTYRWVKFNNSVSLSDSSIAAPIIAFAQNQTSADSLFNIRLSITSIDGCVHDTTRPITQVAAPLSQFSLNNKGCGPINLQALNLTSNVPANSVWTVDPTSGVNIATSNSVSPNITFPVNLGNDSIIYKVRLVSTRSTVLDCRDTSYRNITIYPKPTIDFNISDTALCSPALFSFSNQSTPKNGEPISSMLFNWNFGNGILSGAKDTLMRYTNSSTIDNLFTVKLRGTTQHGCSDSTSKTVRIWPDAKAVYSATNTLSCAPFVINASNIVASAFPEANSSYEWYANQNLIGTGINFPGFTLTNQSDSVKIKLKTISKNACKNDSVEVWFYTIENPKPRFIAVDSISCSGSLVQFNNQSTPNFGLSFQWFFGNQTLGSTQNNPSLVFNNYGILDTTIFVKLITIAGGTGCKDSLTKPIIIKPLPNPSFNFSDSINCFPKTVMATINSANTPPINSLTYNWQAGEAGIFILNDSASVSTSLSFNDNQTGNNNLYWVRLKVQSDFGCLDSIQKTVRVPTRPIANFNFALDSGCGPYNTIASSSSNYASAFQWLNLQTAGNIVNPSLSTTNIQFPGHRGGIDSIYKIRLIVTSNEGCIDSIEKPVSVFPKPIARFISSLDSGCAPLPIQFISQSDIKKLAFLNWQFGDGNGTSSISDTINHTFLGSIFRDTTFFTRLIIRSANGCLDTTSKSMFIESGAVANIYLPDTQLCSSKTNPTTLRIENKSYGSVDTFYWDFGDGQALATTADSNILHPYNKEGYYQITLKAVNDCRESFDTAYVLVQTPPNLLVTKTDSVGCSPMNVTFTNASTDTFRASFNWNMGNGNLYTSFQVPVQTYLQSIRTDTFYFINHSISNFCGNFVKKDTVRVLPKPTSFFLTNTDSGCSPLPVFMLNQSFGVPQQFLWHFGNGNSSTRQIPIQNPIVYSTIDTPSTYTIRLIVTNICGSDTSYRKVKVMPNTVKSFFTADVQNGCDKLTVQFTDYAIGGQNVSWNFGDGSGSTIKNPRHTFSNPGIYRVFQYVNNNCSFDTSSVLINVYPSPRFTLDKITTPICVKSPVFFKANLQDPGTITWHFGDGDSSQLINPVHYYQTAGLKVFRATLISNINYCSKTIIDSVFVNPLPGVKLLADTLRACQNVQFRFIGSTLQPSFLIWDLGDSTFRLGDSITQLFNKPGNYNIRLIATNAAGCSDTATSNVTVYPVPTASFGLNPKDTCSGPAWVNFTNTSEGANAYQWKFGNGNNSNNVNERQFFSGIGKYNNQLIATNSFLCKDTSEAIFEIFEKPVPEFTFSTASICAGEAVSFTNKSKLGASYLWFFGDGDSSTLENPTHIYKDSGQYKVTLFVYAGTICFDSLSSSQFITVHPKPNPSFIHTVNLDKKPNREVFFQYTGTHGHLVNWQFGDGNLSLGNNPFHTYGESDSGCFEVKLNVQSFYGCDTTLSDTICLPGYWKGLFVPNAFTPNYGIDEVQTFLPAGKELKNYHLKIYTKWGELVWESTELKDGKPVKGWDGKHKDTGNDCEQGAYIWTLEAVFTDNKPWDGMLFPGATKQVKFGNVTLIR